MWYIIAAVILLLELKKAPAASQVTQVLPLDLQILPTSNQGAISSASYSGGPNAGCLECNVHDLSGNIFGVSLGSFGAPTAPGYGAPAAPGYNAPSAPFSGGDGGSYQPYFTSPPSRENNPNMVY
jgi:hypothetical protein